MLLCLILGSRDNIRFGFGDAINNSENGSENNVVGKIPTAGASPHHSAVGTDFAVRSVDSALGGIAPSLARNARPSSRATVM